MVSAGFEVSATVGHDNQTEIIDSFGFGIMNKNNDIGLNQQPSTSYNLDNTLGRRNMGESLQSGNNKDTTDHLLDTMVDWLAHVPENEL